MPRAAPVRVPPRGVDPDARADAHWHVRAFFLHVSSETPPRPPRARTAVVCRVSVI